MKPTKQKAPKKSQAVVDPWPPIFMEALACHETGHAVMAVLLNVPMTRIVIGPACDDPNFNAKVELDLEAINRQMQYYKSGLVHVASEPAEKLAPNHGQFAAMHKTCRHLKPLSVGVKSDLILGLNSVAVIYQLLGLAESTARQQFKREYRDLAHLLFDIPVNNAAVHRLAKTLMTRHELSGEEAKSVILSKGPLTDAGLLKKWQAPM